MSNVGRPFHDYRAYGTERPPVEKLVEFERGLRDTQSSWPRAAHAEVLIDLATVLPEQAEDYIAKADEAFNSLMEDANVLLDRGYENEVKSDSRPYMHACLRLAELPNWLQAVQGETVATDYEAMLSAANLSIDYSFGENGLSALAEYVPSLLFARAREQRNASYTGRLALLREDQRLRRGSHNGNPSWDIGLSGTDTAEDFMMPHHLLQITKTLKDKRAGDYNKAGVLLLRAQRFGFRDPVRVVDSCLAEVGENMQNDTPLLTPGELDEMTLGIARFIDDGSEQFLGKLGSEYAHQKLTSQL